LAGLYIHIPFCRKACHYCDFVFTTQTRGVDEFVRAILLEIDQRCKEINDKPIKTVYFGGGTPSLIGTKAVETILRKLSLIADLSHVNEITLEANPEDLNPEKLRQFRELGINRLSLGVQSFSDDVLKSINRAHDCHAAKKAIHDARAVGFDNLNLDLIFGFPGQDTEQLDKDLDAFLSFSPEHISAYSLTIEPKTYFGRSLQRKLMEETPEEAMAGFFLQVRERLLKHGYEHYEISNYALKNKESIHNSSYWINEAYIGLGPGAHSYDGELIRRWNTSSITGYSQRLVKQVGYFETEQLSPKDKANEFIFTRLRTQKGLPKSDWEKAYHLTESQIETLEQLIKEGWLMEQEGHVKLTEKGMLHADTLSAALFYD
jgi:oxygen-independent coproporphyrinogen-3 oxidase